ncbi:hypothetical protein ACEQ8H_007241 [Pleosporales sp. CAS-2024a]
MDSTRCDATASRPVSPSHDTAMPMTPTRKQPSTNPTGLLTPCTPNVRDMLERSQSSSPSLPLCHGGDVATQLDLANMAEQGSAAQTYELPIIGLDKTQQEVQDAQLAASLANERGVSDKRRSTRLQAKKKLVHGDPPVAAPRPAASATKAERRITPPVDAPMRDAAPPESSLEAEAVVFLPADENPALLTLDWQLQYPPGGGTHPSYPYPRMDPRLMFHPSQVPVVRRLPCLVDVSPLLLPMGWRHVTWSGLLPVVFDPYHQAFKLTPMGPLPLTGEEVQQGGLAKYVPGGTEHPEAGLLPDASCLGDGLGEVFSFDHVDWELPWPKGESFHSHSPSGTGAVVRWQQDGCLLSPAATQSGPVSSAMAIMTPPPLSHYLEARDCPDGIVDMTDAWRWLTEKESDPTSIFTPSPGKSWRGTGVYLTTRRYKEPIPSIMGLAMANVTTACSPNTPVAPPYLINQNGRMFCPWRSVATPVQANITLLKDVEITLVELLSYFPSHYLWRKCADRLVGAGLTSGQMANFINWTRLLQGDATRSSESINYQIGSEPASPGSSRKRVKIVRPPHMATYTTEGWEYTASQLADYPLLGLTYGLKHVPQGADAGPLTAAIKWVREQGRFQTMLSQVPALLEEAGIQPLIEPGKEGDPDKEVIARFEDVLKADRKRVLRDASIRKSAAESAETMKRKRVKKGSE